MFNSAAYALENRSSDISADVVARLGFVPDRIERKMTVGQQRRGRRRRRQRGRRVLRDSGHGSLAMRCGNML